MFNGIAHEKPLILTEATTAPLLLTQPRVEGEVWCVPVGLFP